MKRQAGKGLLALMIVLLVSGGTAAPAGAAGEIMYDYTKIPAFLDAGINPNLLLMIDNSASMYDPAFRSTENDKYCYVRADEDVNGNGLLDTNPDGDNTTYDSEDYNRNGKLDKFYDPTMAYAGYFDSGDTSWYVLYHPTMPEFWTGNGGWPEFVQKSETDAQAFCTGKGGTIYTNSELCLTIDTAPDPDHVLAFAAKGRFLNWLMASKFDVEKKVLTGGKYSSLALEKVMENRGCDDRSFIKDIPVTSGGVRYVASFGIRPPTAAEIADDQFYYIISRHNTRLDIYPVTTAGMHFAACSAAIEDFTSGNLGNIKVDTANCLDPINTGLVASATSFNHIMQECWYYNKNGTWQPGGGTVTSMKNDCEKVYNTTPGAAPGAEYMPPETLGGSDICYGQYDPAHPAGGPWGSGYVGQCWEPKIADYTWVNRTCDPATDPTVNANPRCRADGYWYVCDGSYNDTQDKCTGSPGTWTIVRDLVPLPGEEITSVDWTDDNSDAGYSCVDAALKKYCQGIDVPTTIDPSDYTDPQGSAWGLPALISDSATKSQLGEPLVSAAGRIYSQSHPSGLLQEFKYNLRVGAMQNNHGTKSECRPIESPVGSGHYIASLYDCLDDKGADIKSTSQPADDPVQFDGGKVVSYIDDGDRHNTDLINSINDIVADSWTPTSEALFDAIGYFTQDNVNNLRINPGDFIWDHDAGALGAPAWSNGTYYSPNAKVTFTEHKDSGDETKLYFTYDGGTANSATGDIKDDIGVRWTPYDPVIAGCQTNHILIITDGASTADYDGASGPVNSFVAGHNDGEIAKTWKDLATGTISTEATSYECRNSSGSTLYGSTLLDDLTYYAFNNGSSIYQGTYQSIGGVEKNKIKTHLVVTGTLPPPTDPDLECEPKINLAHAVANSAEFPDDVLNEASDLNHLEKVLRDQFKAIGGNPSSGSAASVISNSRSGEGAIYQAVFYPKQVDGLDNDIAWAGDVHAMWLDNRGNIREDCGATGCGSVQDFTLDQTQDPILQFYTDSSNSALARRFGDANGDGYCDDLTDIDGDGLTSDPDKTCDPANQLEDDISLRDIRYLWSAGEWLAQVTQTDVENQRSYNGTNKQRYIVTSFNGSDLIPFTPAEVHNETGDDAYKGYFHASSVDEADNIIKYIRGKDIPGYRSRLIDWDGDGVTEIWKLGDIVHSTPTVVSQPAEDYDTIYQDRSYQAFRKHYEKRRAVIYAGGNDGGLHAFNGGWYDRANQQFRNAPPVDGFDPAHPQYKTGYDLGAEMWMFVPENILPHLKWLTNPDYFHVYYVDLKPYIFDAKIFAPDADHPRGWGTVLVGGMRFGGGNIGVDLDPTTFGDEATMRSSYFILDITNPEVAPRLLGEFTDPDLGFTTVAPTAIPMLRCDRFGVDPAQACPENKRDDSADTWPMDWYLAFGSGPHDSDLPLDALNGNSDQTARLFIYPLGGTHDAGPPAGMDYVGTFTPTATQKTFPVTDAANMYSYFSDIVAVDYDLNFKTDVLYFGSVEHADQEDHRNLTGGVQRLNISEDLDPAHWGINTFFRTPGNQPVTAAPSVAWDGREGWVFVGTGIYYSALLDKPIPAQQSFYGLKERYSSAGNLLLGQPNGGNLVDVSDVWVENQVGTLSEPVSATITGPLSAATFTELDLEMNEKDDVGLDKYHGWKLDFDIPRERNLGQAAILGDIVTFTTYVPSTVICEPEGDSYLWAAYYRTGTAYQRQVIGTRDRSGTEESLRKVDIGPGMSTTPNIHTGAEAGSKAFVQTSTGAIISIEQTNPGVTKSGIESWRGECK